MSLLQVENLSIRYGDDVAVHDLSFVVAAGESVGLVGESGSGKTQTALAILGLLPKAAIATGAIRFAGTDILGASEKALDDIRAVRVAMVFQDPMQALNPYVKIGRQVGHILVQHDIAEGDAVHPKVIEMLQRVGLPDPQRQFNAYPHQLSGGMRQRVMIASALIAEPDLLIADEPTTALDVTVQAQILELLKELTRQSASSLVLITHDLGVVARYADRVNVMYAGRVVESGPARDIYNTPKHPYTIGLMQSIPRLDDEAGSRLVPIDGQPPDLSNLPPGCPFNPRCRNATERCRQKLPPLTQVNGEHWKACWVDVDAS